MKKNQDNPETMMVTEYEYPNSAYPWEAEYPDGSTVRNFGLTKLEAFVMHNMPEGPIAESHNNKWVWNRKRHYAQIDATIEACKYALERLEEQQ